MHVNACLPFRSRLPQRRQPGLARRSGAGRRHGDRPFRLHPGLAADGAGRRLVFGAGQLDRLGQLCGLSAGRPGGRRLAGAPPTRPIGAEPAGGGAADAGHAADP
ncbi:hypothetical protein G6F57_014572 [Rhizopus arrhizus]|nr:hypothetical protein G6F57_014572 [Rhizopus arrhizus]